jgi:PadR family transcriptional regulator PadR
MVAETPAPEQASDWTSQLRRGALELCVLRLLGDGPNYGYAIVTSLSAWPPLAAGENTLYPLLRRLKKDGQLATFSQASPSGPPRQYFQITDLGRERLRLLQREWEALARAVDQCVSNGASRDQ